MDVPPRLYGLDIETDTRVDGLDPAVAGIVAVAVARGGGSDGGVDVLTGPDEATLLARLDGLLADLDPGVLVTWNGAAFDLPFLADRATRHGVALGLRLALDPTIPRRHPPLQGHRGAYRASWHRHAHLDAYPVYQADVTRSLGVSGSLKAMARLCGLRPVELDRATLHRQRAPALAAYVGSDAACTANWPAAAGARPVSPSTPGPGRIRTNRPRPIPQVTGSHDDHHGFTTSRTNGRSTSSRRPTTILSRKRT